MTKRPRAALGLEPLEARLAPAATFGYLDVDGDIVTVTTSKGTNQDLANIIAPYLSNEGVASGKELQRIDFSQNPAAFEHTDLRVTARRGPSGGDGLVNVGYIDATDTDGGGNLDLGNLTISGDLGRIIAGDSTTGTAGVKSLTVGSMGRYGTDTQSGAGPSQDSFIMGGVGKLSVRGDIKGGSFVVSGGAAAADGRLGALSIGGSLSGGSTNVSGFISTTGNLGPVHIGGNMEGSESNLSGRISSGAALGAVTIGGSLYGGKGAGSGYLSSVGQMGPVKIGGDIASRGHDRLVGAGDNVGVIYSGGGITSVTVGGSLFGGINEQGARIEAVGNLGPVKIAGSLVGGSKGTARITAGGTLASVAVGGSMRGGGGGNSAVIESTKAMGTISIGGDLIGGTGGDNSGTIFSSATISRVTLGGSLIGGGDPDTQDLAYYSKQSGGIQAIGKISKLTIGRDLNGGSATQAGYVSAGSLDSLSIGGSLIGGLQGGGYIFTSNDLVSLKIGDSIVGGIAGFGARVSVGGMLGSLTVNGSLVGDAQGTAHIKAASIGAVKIKGDVQGGPATLDSGEIESLGAIASVVIGGSLVGGTGGVRSGFIDAAGAIGPVRIGHDLKGGDSVKYNPVTDAGSIQGQRIASLFVGGSIIAGIKELETLLRSGSVHATDDIGPITVRGSLIGNPDNPVLITARGQAVPTATTDLAIKSLTVGGRVELARIYGGADKTGVGANGNAQIGAVYVGGDFIASTLESGCTSTDGYFGDDNDAVIAGGTISRIASVVIKGGVFGTPGDGTDTFAIVAQQIGSFKVAGTAFPFTAGASNDTFSLGKAQPLGAGRSTATPDSFEVHVFEV